MRIAIDERILDVMERYYDYTAKVEELGLGSAIEEKPRIDVSICRCHVAICMTREADRQRFSTGQRAERDARLEAFPIDQVSHARSGPMAARQP
jgi:hypothetical protein